MFKRIALLLLTVVIVLAVVLGVNTMRHGSRQLASQPVPAITVDEKGVADRLSAAIRLRTISSFEDSTQNADEFLKLHTMLESSYPNIHKTLTREVVGTLSLLYTWQGSDPSLPAIMLIAHQDVVPISPGTEKDWKADPFAGEIKSGEVWGRGAWDDKGNLITQMEAIEMLIAEGFQPKRTILLAYGADEETSGDRGAARIAATLKSHGVKIDFIIDEGLLVTEGIMPGLTPPAALIGVSEKGYVSYKIKTTSTPGHSSMPLPRGDNAIAKLSGIMTRLENEQMPAEIQGVAREMFETIAPEMNGFNRVALSNLWLLGPVVKSQLEKAPGTNAMLRTTTALTVMQAGNKDNVIPGVAEGTVNFRLLPGDTRESVLQHIKSKINDPSVEVSALNFSSEAAPVSSTSSSSYQLINRTMRSLFPGTIVAPGLMLGATDSRHYLDFGASIYRFSPLRARQEDLARLHGVNERISTANLVDMVRFYHEIVRSGGAQ